MKLYIWNDPYPVRYGASCAYVVAESVEQAREILIYKAKVAHYGNEPRDDDTGDHLPPEVLGPPDRIHDAPYGEIYEWSE